MGGRRKCKSHRSYTPRSCFWWECRSLRLLRVDYPERSACRNIVRWFLKSLSWKTWDWHGHFYFEGEISVTVLKQSKGRTHIACLRVLCFERSGRGPCDRGLSKRAQIVVKDVKSPICLPGSKQKGQHVTRLNQNDKNPSVYDEGEDGRNYRLCPTWSGIVSWSRWVVRHYYSRLTWRWV